MKIQFTKLNSKFPKIVIKILNILKTAKISFDDLKDSETSKSTLYHELLTFVRHQANKAMLPRLVEILRRS